MIELTHKDAQTRGMKDEYLFQLIEKEPVLVSLELKKYDDSPTFVNK